MTYDVWLAKYPHLQAVGYFHSEIEAALADGPDACPGIPNWDNYADDFSKGVPLLYSLTAAIDLRPAGFMLQSLIERLISSELPSTLAEECRSLRSEILGQSDDAVRNVVAVLLGKRTFPSAHSGLLYHLGWNALAKYLRPVTDAFARWRQEECWFRSYCPTCGALPSMGQLVGTDPDRRRYLSCGHCATRWWYRRTGCPFCTDKNNYRLAILAVEGEALRIDYCDSCRGYLKTYVGEGDEVIFLADWTSIHLDLIAQDRGLKRLASSLYGL